MKLFFLAEELSFILGSKFENVDYQKILTEVFEEVQSFKEQGKIANYIPELAKVNPEQFGMTLNLMNGGDYSVGIVDEKFSLQSISKVFSLTLALSIKGESILKRVGVEPSGDPFNSLIQLEYENGIPRNPFINAGAIVIADILYSELDNPKIEFIEFIRKIADNKNIHYNEKVAHSEYETGSRNASLAYFLKSAGNLQNDVAKVLDLYFHICSVEMSCDELAKAFHIYANHGVSLPVTAQNIEKSQIKRINAIMQTCGFYDESGQFSFLVGLPGKSGVGGGIVAIYPNKYSVAAWSPRLNDKGNSVMGMKALELLTSKSGLSIF